jgi:3-mercaptopyruvate sulfurtransferase SseA
VALLLRKHGIRRVRPLLGGFYEWKHLGYPLVDVGSLIAEATQSDTSLPAEQSA